MNFMSTVASLQQTIDFPIAIFIYNKFSALINETFFSWNSVIRGKQLIVIYVTPQMMCERRVITTIYVTCYQPHWFHIV